MSNAEIRHVRETDERTDANAVLPSLNASCELYEAPPAIGDASLTSGGFKQFVAGLVPCATDCGATIDLARRIISSTKPIEDDWPTAAEVALRSRLDEIIRSDPRAAGKRVLRQVYCTLDGCVVYRSGRIVTGVNYLYESWAGVRDDPTVANVNLQGQWPNEVGTLNAVIASETYQLIVFVRGE
jgi:hypothetical protein